MARASKKQSAKAKAKSTRTPRQRQPDWSNIAFPQAKQAISLRIDQDVLDWFRDGGPGYQTRMNAVLRAYVEAQGGRR